MKFKDIPVVAISTAVAVNIVQKLLYISCCQLVATHFKLIFPTIFSYILLYAVIIQSQLKTSGYTGSCVFHSLRFRFLEKCKYLVYRTNQH